MYPPIQPLAHVSRTHRMSPRRYGARPLSCTLIPAVPPRFVTAEIIPASFGCGFTARRVCVLRPSSIACTIGVLKSIGFAFTHYYPPSCRSKVCRLFLSFYPFVLLQSCKLSSTHLSMSCPVKNLYPLISTELPYLHFLPMETPHSRQIMGRTG